MAVLGPRGGIWVPDCRAELAVVHGYAHRLLVFDLPDQLALRITQRASDIRVLGARYERRKARQAGTQYDTLLLAPAVPQRETFTSTSRGCHLPRCGPSVDSVSNKCGRSFATKPAPTWITFSWRLFRCLRVTFLIVVVVSFS